MSEDTPTYGGEKLPSLPKYHAPRGIGLVLGVPAKDLRIPESMFVRIRHLHAGNSTKSQRRRAQYVTVVEVRDIVTEELKGIWKAIPRNGDRPNRARGLQVALGGAIIRALCGDKGMPWIGRKSGFWAEGATRARELQKCPECVRYVFERPADKPKRSDSPAFFTYCWDDLTPTQKAQAGAMMTQADKGKLCSEYVFTCGRNGKVLSFALKEATGWPKAKWPEDTDVQSAVNPFRTEEGDPTTGRDKDELMDAVRVKWSDLNEDQAQRARNLLSRALKVNPSIRDCATHDYMIKNGIVTGVLPAAEIPASML